VAEQCGEDDENINGKTNMNNAEAGIKISPGALATGGRGDTRRRSRSGR
jgi:hypothetical protein